MLPARRLWPGDSELELPMRCFMMGESGLAVRRRRLLGEPCPALRRFVLGELALVDPLRCFARGESGLMARRSIPGEFIFVLRG